MAGFGSHSEVSLPQDHSAILGGKEQLATVLKRIFDIGFSLFLILLLLAPIIVIALAVKITSRGTVIHWSNRVGKNNRLFRMPKFRSMRMDTPQIATHLLSDPSLYLTPMGGFLRRTSLDELPQLFSILVGDLSFVGPRPALFNQDDLVALRTERGVHSLVPGLTGWAQVNGRDELAIQEKARLDSEYMHARSLWLDLKIIAITLFKVARREGVSH